MSFSKQDALKIVEKLDARINKKTNRHDRALIEYDGKIILGFGIRRSSKEKGHDFLPSQLKIRRAEVKELISCSLDKNGYFDLLRDQGTIK